jgi:hypothetical protein
MRLGNSANQAGFLLTGRTLSVDGRPNFFPLLATMLALGRAGYPRGADKFGYVILNPAGNTALPLFPVLH